MGGHGIQWVFVGIAFGAVGLADILRVRTELRAAIF
jgi:hypothetical protein